MVLSREMNYGIFPKVEIFYGDYNINPTKLTSEVGLSTPAIGSDGTIYVGGDKLYAIEQNGSLRWSFSGLWPESIRNAPVIGNDGTVYLVYHNIPLTALNPIDGSVKWSLSLGVDDHCFASPAIGTDGTIYVATQPRNSLCRHTVRPAFMDL